jgi:hypothetical protein
MGTLEVAFAVVVTVLAAVCVILALVVAAYWLAVQVRRLRAQLHPPPLWRREAWWRERGATAPTIPQRRKWQ